MTADDGERGEYGRRVLTELARKLTNEFGRGWSEQQLRHCTRLAEIYPDEPILSAVRRELSWTQIKTLTHLDAPLKRDFDAELCRLERWSSRQLNERIQSMLFERSALSRNPDDVIRSELANVKAARQLSPDLVHQIANLEMSLCVERTRYVLRHTAALREHNSIFA